MSPLKIKPIHDRQAWDRFVEPREPNTFLQSWEWGQVQEASGEGIRYLGVFAGDEQRAAALVLTVRARRGYHYLIPHGPITDPSADTTAILRALVDYLRDTASSDRAVAVRLAPLLEDTFAARSSLARLGFKPAPLHVHAELTWVLDITPDDEALLAGMRKTTRHAIRRAEKAGITCEITTNPDDLDRFLPLYAATTARHHFVPYTAQMLRQQLDIFSRSNRVFMVVARYQNRDVAGAMCFHFGNTFFYYHGASERLPASLPAAQLVQWCAIREAKRRGAAQYNFWGIAADDTPKHPFAGITVFKKGFGGRAYNYLHAHDLPLSVGYAKLWLIDSWRKWRRGF